MMKALQWLLESMRLFRRDGEKMEHAPNKEGVSSDPG
jgi:hypothetical protein